MTRNNNIFLICMSFLVMLSVSLPFASAQIVFQLPGFWVKSAAVGDFNHDGVPDLVAVIPCHQRGYCGTSFIELYLGDGLGGYRFAAYGDLGARSSGRVVLADVNGDGNLDVVVPVMDKGLAFFYGDGTGGLGGLSHFSVGAGTSGVSFPDLNGDGKVDMVVARMSLLIFLGDGTGNFTLIDSNLPSNDGNMLIGDFNGDGKIDIAATDSSGFSVYLGNGDGTLRPPLHTEGPYDSLAIGNFGADGKLDLVATTWGSSNVTILRGNGDGTFSPVATYLTGQNQSAAVIVGDFNKDGKADVAVADACWVTGWPCPTSGAVTILLGNGDYTLQKPYSYDAGGRVCTSKLCQHFMMMLGADLNHDGNADLVTLNQCNMGNCKNGGTFGLLLGNGDGTFQSAPVSGHFISTTILSSSPNPSTYGQAVKFVSETTTNGPYTPTGTVAFKGTHISGYAEVNAGVAEFSTTAISAGTVAVTSHYSGDSENLKSESAPYTQTVSAAPTATTVTSASNPSSVGQKVTITATVTSAFAPPKGTVIFVAGNTSLGTIKLSGGKAILKTAALPAGTSTIMATYNPALNAGGGVDFVGSSGTTIQIVK